MLAATKHLCFAVGGALLANGRVSVKTAAKSGEGPDFRRGPLGCFGSVGLDATLREFFLKCGGDERRPQFVDRLGHRLTQANLEYPAFAHFANVR